MNRAKRVLSCSNRFIDLFFSSELSQSPSCLIHGQVSSKFANFSSYRSLRAPCLSTFGNPSRSFSKTPEKILGVFSANDWDVKLDEELGGSKIDLTHENVVYVLKKLSKEPKKASRFFRWAVETNGFEPSSPIYSLILRIFADESCLKEFWVTIKEMKDKGYYIDRETYKTLFAVFRGLNMENEATALKHFYERLAKENDLEDRAKTAVDLIRSFAEWGDEIETKLSDMNLTFSDNFVLMVLKGLKDKDSLAKAYPFFKWVASRPNFEHSSITYNALLRILCWEESISVFWRVMEEMNADGFELDIDTYIKVSRQLQKNKMLGDAVKLYEHMMETSYKPSDKECILLLRTIATHTNPNFNLIHRVVNKYESTGHSLSKPIYDGVHRALTSLGKFEEAEEIVERMRKAGFEPDNITYSQIIFGLCKARSFEDAMKVLDLMKERECPPDIKTWTVLIKGHIEGNEVDNALLCYAKMVGEGFDADADLLDVLINGFVAQSRVVGAYHLLYELVKKAKLRPWQATYKNLIERLINERKLEEAMELLKMMKVHNYPPHAEPFVRYISKFGSVENAGEFLKALSAKSSPTISAYQHVFKAFFEEGRHSEAKDLLFKCPHHVRKHSAVASLFGSAEGGLRTATKGGGRFSED